MSINAIQLEIYEKAYKEYRDECRGISMMAPSSSFGKGGIAEAYKRAFLHAVDYAFNAVKNSNKEIIDLEDGKRGDNEA